MIGGARDNHRDGGRIPLKATERRVLDEQRRLARPQCVHEGTAISALSLPCTEGRESGHRQAHDIQILRPHDL